MQTQLNLQYVPASARRNEPEKPARVNALLVGVDFPFADPGYSTSAEIANALTSELHLELRMDDLSLRLVAHTSTINLLKISETP